MTISPHSRRRFLQNGLALAGLGLLSGCGLPPLSPQQPKRLPRIGYLAQDRPDDPSFLRHVEALRQGLRELGWVEGENIALEVRWADRRQERMPELAAELVRLPVDVLLAGGGTNGALVARQATATIPIVMVAAGDPVGVGLVASFNRPGGNITGLTSTAPEIAGKLLDLLRETVPGIARVDYLANPENPRFQASWDELQVAARALGVAVRLREAHGRDGLDGAFAAMAGDRPDALVVQGDPSFFPHAHRVADLVAGIRLPAIYQFREFAEGGGLMSYGVSSPDLWRRAAAYVDKILKGAKPADLPVEQPTTFDLVINFKTAQALGLSIPQSVLQQATEVIQ